MNQTNDKSENFCVLTTSGSKFFWRSKRLFDLLISILLIPVFLFSIASLLPLNFFLNRGSLFFIQERMGLNCVKFNAIKFRTMSSNININRKFDDPIEYDRITKLGGFMRSTRIDEIPQIINVIKGEMSLIGPRPDNYEHAIVFIDKIEGYKSRHVIRPGISGLSQIRLGYAEGLSATRKKSFVDHYYIKNASFSLDSKIFLGTLVAIFNRMGV